MKNVLYVGVDVDDSAFHAGAFCNESGEVFEFVSKPNLGDLLKKLQCFIDLNYDLKVCYEATYTGYTLCRELRNKGID